MRRKFFHYIAFLCVAWLGAFGVHASPVKSVPPVMQLSDAIAPLAYDAALTVVPEQDGFDGRIAIDVDIARELDFFWLNGTELTVRNAHLVTDDAIFTAQVVRGNEDFIGFKLNSPIPAGKARLVIEYSGMLSRSSTRGLFKQKEGEDWYVLSQFEALHARRAFPCFDEPRWKTPWSLALTVRREHAALANTPQVAEEIVSATMKRIRFAPSEPLPTYLVAIGVGPFDIVDGGVAGVNNIPLRYITPKGRGSEARYAAKITPVLLNQLEEYFGRPYPYAKLDSIVIPVTVNFGAMENAGLITYRASIMLAKPEREDDRFQRRYANIAAHELAHQWFGNLVTMQWWNDLWLNESFATWMARKVVGKFNPEWDAEPYREEERQEAMHVDRLASTRRIRQPVLSRDDLANAFDSITYDKGGAVLTMMENAMGEAAFRNGVRRYINRHAFGNATAEDFFAAVAEGDPALSKAFSSFVEQAGVPLVSMKLDCSAKPALHLAQQRFLPGSKTGAETRESLWTIPVCVRYEGQQSDKSFCALLNGKQAKWPLPEAATCPTWVLPNPAGQGYFLSTLDPKLLERLPVASLKAHEAASLTADLDLLAKSGTFPLDQLLQHVARYAHDARPEVVKAAAEVVANVRLDWMNGKQQEQFADWILRHFGEQALKLGWLPKENDTDAIRSLRAVLLPLVADKGGEPALRAEARGLALKWISGEHRQQLGAMARPVLKSAAYTGDQAMLDAIVAVVGSSRDNGEREELFRALGSFTNAQLREQAFALALSDRLDIREAMQMFRSAADAPHQAYAVFNFVRKNREALIARLPEHYAAGFPRWGKQLCTVQERNAFKSYHSRHTVKLPGARRNLAQALESIDICIASRKTQQPRLHRFLTSSKL